MIENGTNKSDPIQALRNGNLMRSSDTAPCAGVGPAASWVAGITKFYAAGTGALPLGPCKIRAEHKDRRTRRIGLGQALSVHHQDLGHRGPPMPMSRG